MTDLTIQVGATVKAVKYEGGETELVEVKFLGKNKVLQAGYDIMHIDGRVYRGGYEIVEGGAFMLAFTV